MKQKNEIDLKTLYKLIFPYKQNFIPVSDKMSKEELYDFFQNNYKNTPKIHLKNKCNSCYFDSVIVSFFYDLRAYKWLNKNILSKYISLRDRSQFPEIKMIQEKLRYLYSFLYRPLLTEKNVTYNDELVFGLKKDFKSLSQRKSIFQNTEWIRSQQEPNDVLSFLNYIFDIREDVKFIELLPNGKKKTKNTTFNGLGIWSYFLLNNKTINIENILFGQELTLKSANILFLPVFRTLNNGKKSFTVVEFPEVIIPSNKKSELVLSSIIVHYGKTSKSGHFVSYLYDILTKKWLEVNDLKQDFKEIDMKKDLNTATLIKQNVISILYVNKFN